MNKKFIKRRSKLINNILKESVKKYGEGATVLLSSDKVSSVVKKTISTGSPELDRILAKDRNGHHGMPVGRIIGVSGKEASGKTTLLIMLMKQIQKMGGLAILIETEHAFDPNYAEKLGLDLDDLILAQPEYLEQGLDMIKNFALMFKEAKEEHLSSHDEEWSVPMFIGFDSIAGVPPKAEYEANSFEEEQALGLHARRLSKFFRKISGIIANEQICFVCTNQLKIDTNVRYGNPDTEIGGKALKFHASLRLDLRQSGFIRKTQKGDPIGIETTAKTIKNKVMLPYKSVTIPIIFGDGIDYTRSLFNAFRNYNIVKKAGSWYILNYTIRGKEQEIRAHGENRFIKLLSKELKAPIIKKKLERLLDE
jgi:recombination protein RecA